MFEKDWKTLNKAQQSVVHNIKDALLVLAPAGTGKTKVIAMRTAYLLQQEIAPTSILCLTFTNKAAKEMEQRIALYDRAMSRQLTIKTFHSFCYYLINQEKQNARLAFPCTIIDESDTEEIIRRIVFALTMEEWKRVNTLTTFIENVKKHRLVVEPEHRHDDTFVVKDYLRVHKTKDPLISQYGLKLLKNYERYLRDNNCIDFTDLILEATYLLEDPVICAKWQKRYQYIQVDEMQDTSIREYHIIKTLAQYNHVALYGDFNQTIYEWRGSAPCEMIEDYKTLFSPVEISLETNYRSTQLLLKAANGFIRNSNLYPTLSMPSVKEIGEPIEVFCGRTKTREMELITQSLVQHYTGGDKEVAILTRTNGLAKDLYRYLEQKGIPCIKVEDIRLMRRPEVKDLLSVFNYTVNPRNSYALEKVIKHPVIHMEEWLIKALKQTKSAYMSLHDWFLAENNDPYYALIKGFEHNQVIVLDVESTGLDTTTDDIIQIAAICYGKEGVKAQLDILVKPTKLVGDSFFVHGFSDEQLEREGIGIHEALEQLADFTHGKVVVGHNVKYDLSIIESMCSRYQQPPLEHLEVYDTLDLAHKMYPKLSNHKLDTLSHLIQTKATPNHNALQDILATSEVLTHFIEKLVGTQTLRYSQIEAYYPYVAIYKKQVQELVEAIRQRSTHEGISYLMNSCGYKAHYKGEELSNLRDFYKMAEALYTATFSYADNRMRLLAFSALHASEVEQSALFKGKVPVMTMHQAKGLEFDYVYMAGCNEGVFPSSRSVQEGYIEEEKRLFYVGMTRARKKLYLSYNNSKPMSFLIEEIEEDFKKYRQDT
ncbi:MAG: 3'-5' exonuclease [Niameybacter sp.]